MPPKYKYKIAVREPNWASSVYLWEEFDDAGDAEEFIKDIASTYPEGTLFFLVASFYQHLYTRKSFVVNEYGELEKRRRKWVPDKAIPLEWMKEIPPEPISPYNEIEGYKELSADERFRLDRLLYKMGIDTNPGQTWERGKEKGYFYKEDLENL